MPVPRILLAACVLLGLTAPAATAAAPPTPAQSFPPSGQHAAKAPAGYILTIHGGGWQNWGAEVMQSTVAQAQWFAGLGWHAANIDYRPGAAGLQDVLDQYDQIRQIVGPAAKVCSYGESAGGHLSLMLAYLRPSVNCVINGEGPTDLVDANDVIHHLADPVFGPAGGNGAWSPARLPITTPVLLVHADNDLAVPVSQGEKYRDAHKDTSRLLVLRAGARPYVHSQISDESVLDYMTASSAFLADIAAGRNPFPRISQPGPVTPPSDPQPVPTPQPTPVTPKPKPAPKPKPKTCVQKAKTAKAKKACINRTYRSCLRRARTKKTRKACVTARVKALKAITPKKQPGR